MCEVGGLESKAADTALVVAVTSVGVVGGAGSRAVLVVARLGPESLARFSSNGYYTGTVNSADSTDFTGPDKSHSLVLTHAMLFVLFVFFHSIN